MGSYIPCPLEGFQIHELAGDGFVAQVGFVLLQQPAADFGVFGLRDGVFDVGFFETVERDDDAVDFGEGVVEVALRGCF